MHVAEILGNVRQASERGSDTIGARLFDTVVGKRTVVGAIEGSTRFGLNSTAATVYRISVGDGAIDVLVQGMAGYPDGTTVEVTYADRFSGLLLRSHPEWRAWRHHVKNYDGSPKYAFSVRP